MTSTLRINTLTTIGLLFLLAGLSGCQSLPAASTLFATPSSVFDGAWVGRLSVGIQTPKCNVRRAGIRINVEGGRINGIARSDGKTYVVEGVIEDDGALVGGTMSAETSRNDVELIGTFGEKKASGTWTNQYCNGAWEVSKAR